MSLRHAFIGTKRRPSRPPSGQLIDGPLLRARRIVPSSEAISAIVSRRSDVLIWKKCKTDVQEKINWFLRADLLYTRPYDKLLTSVIANVTENSLVCFRFVFTLLLPIQKKNSWLEITESCTFLQTDLLICNIRSIAVMFVGRIGL